MKQNSMFIRNTGGGGHAGEKLQEFVLARVYEDYPQYIGVFVEKFKTDWKGEQDYFYWADTFLYFPDDHAVRTGGKYSRSCDYSIFLYPLADSYYIIVILVCLLGCVFMIFQKGNFSAFIGATSILGFVLMLTIMEAQGRYKIAIYPILAFLCAPGYMLMSHAAKSLRDKIERRLTLRKTEI